MKVGVFSDAVGGATPEEVAERTAATGADAVQIRLGWPGLDLLERAADRARLRRAYESAGVEVAALAAYTNLLDPQPQHRQVNRAWLEQAIRIAADLGTRVVVTEAGTHHPVDAWSDHPDNHTPAAWAELVAVTGRMTGLCEREGVTLAYEPYVNTVLASAPAARRLADEVASPALAFVLDSAGLVTPETLDENRRITAAAADLLRGRIALAHADDVRYDDGTAHWLPLGWGELDAQAVFAALAAAGFDGALIVEHLDEALVPQALAFCRERMRQTIAEG